MRHLSTSFLVDIHLHLYIYLLKIPHKKQTKRNNLYAKHLCLFLAQSGGEWNKKGNIKIKHTAEQTLTVSVH